MNDVITIDLFNKLTGQDTLHPLVSLADLSGDELQDDLRMPCNFYALVCRQGNDYPVANIAVAGQSGRNIRDPFRRTSAGTGIHGRALSSGPAL